MSGDNPLPLSGQISSGYSSQSSFQSSTVDSTNSGMYYVAPARPPGLRPSSEEIKPAQLQTGEPHPPPDALLQPPIPRHHYSQPIEPTQATQHPPLIPSRDGPPRGLDIPRGSENRSGSMSPQLQQANVPGLGNVLILDPSAASYRIVTDSGLYNVYPTNAEEQGRVGGAIGRVNSTGGMRGGTNAHVQHMDYANAQGGSPLLLIRTNQAHPSQPHPHHKPRSYSQPEAHLQRYFPGGRGGGARRTWESYDGGSVPEESEEGGAYFRHYSTPSRQGINQQQQHVLQQPMEEVTKNILTNKDYGGYDYSFILSHEELREFICPICRLVLRNPHLTDCCGAYFCSTCIREHMSLNNSCPMCKKENYSVFINRNTERAINRLQVKCPNNADGCVWVGPLVDVATHVDLNKGDCDFVRCLCPFCEVEFSLNTLYTHKTDECPRRPFSCKFCSFKSAYEDIPSHWPICDGYPAPCPNDCGCNDMPRRDIPQHLEVCPRKIVECDFKFLGCHSTYPLSDAQLHEESSAHFHMTLMGRMVRELMNREATPTGPTHQDLEGRLEEKDRELSLLRDEVRTQNKELAELRSLVSSLEESQAKLAKDLQKVRSHVVTPPFHFTVYKFNELRSCGKQWFSSPFYTHPQGYRMCISLDCNGSDEGSGTHVSVYANLMRGEFDNELSWPFCGVVVIQLINQYGGGDKGHIVHEIPFTPDVPPEISDRILDQELAESGLGVPQFVAHGQLHLDKYTNCGYLRNESLRFCVTSVRRN